MAKYPKEIYVTREKDGEESYLAVNEKVESVAVADQSIEVAVYALVGVGTVLAPVQLQATFKTTVMMGRKK